MHSAPGAGAPPPSPRSRPPARRSEGSPPGPGAMWTPRTHPRMSCDGAAADEIAEHPDEGGMVHHRARAIERDSDGPRGLPGFHVEIVQDLDVIADEPDRDHDDRSLARSPQ